MSEDNEDYSLLGDPVNMLKAVVMFAPEWNLRLGLIGFVKWFEDMDEDAEVDAFDILDSLAQHVITLTKAEPGEKPGAITEREIEDFRRRLAEGDR